MEDYSDFIIPDEEAATPQAEETTEQQTDATVEDTTETEAQQEQTEQVEQPKVKLKYNHEEKEYSLDEVVPLAQKGMNYDKLQERLKSLESDPRLSFVEELAKQQGFDDVNQYIQAAREWQEQQRLNELVQQNIPEDLAKEIMENRKFRDKFESERQTKAQEEKRNAEFKEFLDAFPGIKAEEIPREVWQMHEQGVPLKYAYMQHDYNQLKNEKQILKQNEDNAKKAPVGSVTAHGSTEIAAEDDFIRGFDSVR